MGESEVYPNMTVTIRAMQGGILNIKWNYKQDKDGKISASKKMPVEVPDNFITTENVPDSTDAADVLSNYIELKSDTNGDDFTIIVKSAKDGDKIFSLSGVLMDSYMNWINT